MADHDSNQATGQIANAAGLFIQILLVETENALISF